MALPTVFGGEDLLFGSRARVAARAFEDVATRSLRYGLVLVLVWIGAMKFTAYEAQAIEGLVAHSPLLGWIYALLDVRTAAALIGLAEIAIAVLIAARPFSAAASAVGSALAVGLFLTTLSLLLSTPGAFEASVGGFPLLSLLPGQFLVKDFALLAIALWSTAEAWRAHAEA